MGWVACEQETAQSGFNQEAVPSLTQPGCPKAKEISCLLLCCLLRGILYLLLLKEVPKALCKFWQAHGDHCYWVSIKASRSFAAVCASKQQKKALPAPSLRLLQHCVQQCNREARPQHLRVSVRFSWSSAMLKIKKRIWHYIVYFMVFLNSPTLIFQATDYSLDNLQV